jgi:uncharacterized Tic20 family protein
MGQTRAYRLLQSLTLSIGFFGKVSVLFIAEVIGGVGLSFLTAFFSGLAFSSFAVPFAFAALGVSLLSFLFSIACVVLVVMGIVNAAQGKMQPLPIIGKWTILK